MNKRILLYISLFTLLVCFLFVGYNPNIASRFSEDYTDGEVFTSSDGEFDFREFSITSPGSHSFTAKTKNIGHVQFTDDTGNVTINYLDMDNMIQSTRDWHNNLLEKELEKPSWSVDGVMVHQLDFLMGESLYSAYVKNSTSNRIIYLSTSSEQKTADIVNSLEFKEE